MAILKGGSAYPPAVLRGNLCRHPLHTVILPCNIMMLNSAAGAGNIGGGVSICGEGCPSAANGVDKDGGRRIPGMHGGTSGWEGGENKDGSLTAAGSAPTGALTKVVGRKVLLEAAGIFGFLPSFLPQVACHAWLIGTDWYPGPFSSHQTAAKIPSILHWNGQQ